MSADSEERPRGADWRIWHTDYDTDSPLRRRLEIVQRHIGHVLDTCSGSPLRVLSLCAGEGRDLLGAIERHRRRDVAGRLIELDPLLAQRAQEGASALGLEHLEVVRGDAGATKLYAGAVPADLVLMCGIFGNISDAHVERTVKALPMLCATAGEVIWTRHRHEPDLTSWIQRWLEEAGFENTAFHPVPDSRTLGAVGVATFREKPQPLRDEHLFTFIRESI